MKKIAICFTLLYTIVIAGQAFALSCQETSPAGPPGTCSCPEGYRPNGNNTQCVPG